MTSLKLGVQLSAQCDDWAQLATAARLVDDLGYDYLLLPDHLAPLQGAETSVMFEGVAALAGLATVTKRVRLGLLVASNTFRNPTVYAKSIATIDHISGGRAVLGLGGGWHAREHEAWGIDFGRSAGQRLDWLDEALSVIRPLLAGDTVTHHGQFYDAERLFLSPAPLQENLPIMVGGSGERKTLRTVARYADIWNAQVGVDGAQHKLDVLHRHCDDVGRDFAQIELSVDSGPFIRDTAAEAQQALADRAEAKGAQPPAADAELPWVGSVEQVAEYLNGYTSLGFTTLTCAMSPPFDEETLTRLIREVKPAAEAN